MATSPVIPKEQQSAYQRWELGTFETPAQASVEAAANVEHVRKIGEGARAEAYAVGYREGLEAAQRDGLVETTARTARLDAMVAALTTDLARLDRELAQEVVQLGFAIARKLVGEALKIRPEIVCQSVETALREVAHISGPVSISVNPEDAALVRRNLEAVPPAGGWSLREDPGVARGGCRLETAAGEVDATINSRWRRITSALGQPVDWIES